MSQTKAQLIDTLVASLLPASDSAVDIGSNAVRFANIYGDTLYGSGANLTGLNIVTDTSPQLGGDLDTNSHEILLDDDHKIKFGDDTDMNIRHTGSYGILENSTGALYLRSSSFIELRGNNNETFVKGTENGSVELYYDNSKKLETTSTGAILSNSSADSVLKINRTDTPSDNDNIGTLLFLGKKSDGADHTYGFIKSTVLDVTTGTTDSKLTFATKTNGSDKEIVFQDGSVYLSDNGKATFGTSADLQLFHDGGNAHFANTTGTFKIKGNDIHLQNAAGSEDYITAAANGAVELYYDNAKKFETKSTGGQITGQLQFADGGSSSGSNMVSFGSSDDLKIYHDSSNSYLLNSTGNLIIKDLTDAVYIQAPQIVFQDETTNENIASFISDGAVELYHDNVKSLETTTEGIEIKKTASGQTARLKIEATNGGQAGIELRTSLGGTNRASRIDMYNQDTLQWSIFNDYQQNGTNDFSVRHGAESAIRALPDGAVELYYDNGKKAETFGSGFKVAGGGELYIDGNAAGGHCQLIMTRSDMSYMIANETYLRFYRAGGNSSSPNTLTAEFTNSGHFRPGANNTYDLGDSSTRWRNIYTNDLNLSNEGGANDVDGTWGSYTIQEGAEDLFLVNKRSGKKYKFNLTEVS